MSSSARGRDPLSTRGTTRGSPARLARRGFAAGLAVQLGFHLGWGSFALVFGLYVQHALGFTPLEMGLALGPITIGVLGEDPSAVRYEDALLAGTRVTITAFALASVAAALLPAHRVARTVSLTRARRSGALRAGR